VNQFTKYIDPTRYAVREQLVADGNRNYILLNRAARPFLHAAKESYTLNDLWAELAAIGSLRARDTDVLHYLDADHTAFLLPQLRGRRASPRIVASYHQPPEILARRVPNHVARALDHLIVVSPDQAAYFADIVSPDRVRMILHGIDTDFFRPAIDTGARRAGPLRCLTVGFWLRDFDALDRVADLLNPRDVEFHVVAPESGSLRSRPNLVIHRNIADDLLRTLYQEADVLFLPLVKATANNALLEGLASGLPVISTRLPSIEAYVGDAETVLIDRNEPDACADAIRRLSDDPEARRRMGQSSRKRAEQLDWRRIATQYEEVYGQ
jgi:glycosyltransferase involved in cell wall biosynthesis